MQSGSVHRELYVQPPKQLVLNRDSVWKFWRLSYGIFEAGGQRQCAVENLLLPKFKGKQVAGTEQIFKKRKRVGKLGPL